LSYAVVKKSAQVEISLTPAGGRQNMDVGKLILALIMKAMDGKKTYSGAAMLILTGIGSLATGLAGIVSDPQMSVEATAGFLIAGCGGIGEGVKGLGLRAAISKMGK